MQQWKILFVSWNNAMAVWINTKRLTSGDVLRRCLHPLNQTSCVVTAVVVEDATTDQANAAPCTKAHIAFTSTVQATDDSHATVLIICKNGEPPDNAIPPTMETADEATADVAKADAPLVDAAKADAPLAAEASVFVDLPDEHLAAEDSATATVDEDRTTTTAPITATITIKDLLPPTTE